MPVVRISDELFKEVQKFAEPLVDNFETALWKALKANERHSEGSEDSAYPIKPTQLNKVRKSKSYAVGELTPSADFWKPILCALIEKGGSANRGEVYTILKQKFAGRLKLGDKEVNRDGTLKWEKQVDYQRLALKLEGLLKNNSPRGMWQISDLGRKWVNTH